MESRQCWDNINIRLTWEPVLYNVECEILIIKQPSPQVNPASQLGSFIFWYSTRGLEIGIVSGKASFNYKDKPLFKEARKFTICCIPSFVKCSFWLNKYKIAWITQNLQIFGLLKDMWQSAPLIQLNLF